MNQVPEAPPEVRRQVRLWLLVAATFGGSLGLGAQQTLPAGAGAEVIRARCVSCHDTDLIMSQRLTPAAWTREIDKMARWGATLSTEQRDVLQPYLAANFGPRPAAAHTGEAASPDAGEATFKRACLSCHGTDIVEPQRLTRAAWVREVEKMMRWGAAVSPTEKDPLVDHLANRFPAR